MAPQGAATKAPRTRPPVPGAPMAGTGPSEATVKTHLTHLYAKLGVNDRGAAVAAAYDRGILG